MLAALNSASHPWLQTVRRYRAWILVGLTILFVVVVRVRLREMPLERDEGEYAYAGQLMLQGVPPYREAYTMKLPGTCAAYALIMAVFGQSASGIHVGLAFVNVASIVLMFLLGRKLLDDAAGVAAAVAFALLSLSPSVLGLAGHATHFVVLAALGGILLLLRASESQVQSHYPSPSIPQLTTFNPQLFFAGLLFGLAFLMKQHGLFFGLFGALYLLRVRVGEWLAASGVITQQPGVRSLRERTGFAFTGPESLASLARLIRDLGWFVLGWVLPCLLTCVVLWWAGAFHQFVFWTLSYAGQYASAIPMVKGSDVLRASLNAVVGPNLVLWVLPWVGAMVMWWESRLDEGSPKSKIQSLKPEFGEPEAGARQSSIVNRKSQIPFPRFFLTTLLFCSFASVSVGLYFREHYFILVLPVLALLTGVAVSRGLHLLKHDQTIELFLALPILGLFVIALGAALIGNGSIWLGMTPVEATRSVYGTTLFTEAARVADYLKSHTAQDDRVAVLGSEPEIYFYAHRRSATGHIYMYPLMEETPFALKMQEEMIGEIERARPACVVYIDDPFSWVVRPNSAQRLFEWWNAYWARDLDLVMTIEVEEGLGRGTDMDKSVTDTPAPNHILVFKRRQ
jgi:4-amino-4-deoxy-L-arabinose transferase-like glycosyltransferase